MTLTRPFTIQRNTITKIKGKVPSEEDVRLLCSETCYRLRPSPRLQGPPPLSTARRRRRYGLGRHASSKG